MQDGVKRKHQILIVEDEGIVAADIQDCLEDCGFEVTAVASSADDAIREASRACPDLVLMDIRIQGARDGIETAGLLRHRFGVPVIYLTAHGDRDTIERAKQTEPMAFLLKPFKQAELENAVEIALYRAQKEKKLREWERWFVGVMGSVGEAVVSADAHGRVTFLNPAAERLTGFSWQEAFGQPIADVVRMFDEHSGGSLESSIVQSLRTKQASALTSAVLLSKHGDRRFVSDSALPVGDESALLGAVTVLRDQSEPRKIRQRLELGDRLASLGAMAASVAHEINNPLTAVIGNIDLAATELEELAATGFDASQASREGLGRANAALRDARLSAGRMAHLVTDLRAFARPAESRSGVIDVHSVLRWALDITAHEMHGRARVCRDFGEVPLIAADETRLGQVLVNLLVNAAQAITPGAAERNEVRVSTRTAPDGAAVIEVQDPGCGMDREVLANIFEPFFTTKPAGTGSGLGLSISHGIVKSLGGKIEVDSESGKGSTFRVVLPPAGNALETPLVKGPNGHPGGRPRVLVIDDELMIRRIIERGLHFTHDVVSVASGMEAARLLADGREFDVILCDVAMPGMSGAEFYEYLSAHHPDARDRVVLLSGGILTDALAEFVQSMKRPCLSKPFTIAELRRVILEAPSAHQFHPG